MFNSTQPVIWGVDALYGKNLDKPQPATLIKAWLGDDVAPVEPVFVCNDIRVEASWDHQDAEKVLRDIEDRSTVDAFSKPKILRNVEPPFTVRKLVSGLLKYAKDEDAQMIVVQSTSKPTHVRMLLGSFTENLIHSSSIPVLVLGAESNAPTSIKKILFATDFSKDSYQAYRIVLEKARQLDAEILLFNQSEAWFGISEGLTEQTKKSEKAEEWAKQAQEQFSVKTEVLVSESSDNKGDAIIRAADQNGVDMIALVSRTGKVEGALLGSTTVNVVRRADLPVLILYPES